MRNDKKPTNQREQREQLGIASMGEAAFNLISLATQLAAPPMRETPDGNAELELPIHFIVEDLLCSALTVATMLIEAERRDPAVSNKGEGDAVEEAVRYLLERLVAMAGSPEARTRERIDTIIDLAKSAIEDGAHEVGADAEKKDPDHSYKVDRSESFKMSGEQGGEPHTTFDEIGSSKEKLS